MADAYRRQQGRRHHAGAQRLGEGFLDREALGEKARGIGVRFELGQLGPGQYPPPGLDAPALVKRRHAFDLHQVGADAVNHARASLPRRNHSQRAVHSARHGSQT